MNHLNGQRDGLCWIVIVGHVQPRLTENRVTSLQHSLLRVPAFGLGPLLKQPFGSSPEILGLRRRQDAPFRLHSTLWANSNADNVVHSPIDRTGRENVGSVQVDCPVNQRFKLALQCVIRGQF